MASPRKSAQQIAAREKARQKAADFTARNEELIELAAKFIEFDDAAQEMETAAQEKAEKIIEQGKADAEQARNESGDVVARMLETGESRSAVAARLGMSVSTLKKYVPTPGPAKSAVVPADA
ncbi:helix-turn-helix domain-containing protein [Paeniglutamicibacter antarcticus]|uniref:Resolvase HTH domain-containing protein n=1 Tax=Paeniglutamicibacter antarcticus TaxID=494023 RepID=A0ABP9THM3_9MICC